MNFGGGIEFGYEELLRVEKRLCVESGSPEVEGYQPFSRGHDVKKRKLLRTQMMGVWAGVEDCQCEDFIYSYPNKDCSPLDTFSRSHPFLNSLVCHSKNAEDYNYKFTNLETHSHRTHN
jgi:hypothetical protein